MFVQMEYVDEEYPGRVTVDDKDAVILKYLLRRDAGPWRCTVYDAVARHVGGAGGEEGVTVKRGIRNETAEMIVKIDYTFFHAGVTSMMVTEYIRDDDDDDDDDEMAR